MAEKLLHAFHPGPAPQQPGRVRVAVVVRFEMDASTHTEATHQVVDRRVGPRAALRLRPQVDEHIVRIFSERKNRVLQQWSVLPFPVVTHGWSTYSGAGQRDLVQRRDRRGEAGG